MMDVESARQAQVPEDLGAFVCAVGQWLRRNFWAAFISAVAGGALGYVLNALLLLFVYGGPQVASGALAFRQGNALWGSLGFALVGMVIGGLTGYWRSVGTRRFSQDLGHFPAALALILKRDGTARVHLLWGAVVSLVVATVISPWVGLFLAAGLMLSLPLILGRLISALVLRLWSALIQTIMLSRNRRPTGLSRVMVGGLGAALALGVGFVLPDAGPMLALVGACAIAALILSRRVSPSAAALLLIVAIELVGIAWAALGGSGFGLVEDAFAQSCDPSKPTAEGGCVPDEMHWPGGSTPSGGTPAWLVNTALVALVIGVVWIGSKIAGVFRAASRGGDSGLEPKATPPQRETPPPNLSPDVEIPEDAPLTSSAVFDGTSDLPDPDLPWEPDTYTSTVPDHDGELPEPDLPPDVEIPKAPLTSSAVLDGEGDLPDPSAGMDDIITKGSVQVGLEGDQLTAQSNLPLTGTQTAEPPRTTTAIEDAYVLQAKAAPQTLDALASLPGIMLDTGAGMLTDVFWNIPKGLIERTIAAVRAGDELLRDPRTYVRGTVGLIKGGVAVARGAYSAARTLEDTLVDATTPSTWTNLADDLARSPGSIVADTVTDTVKDTATMTWQGLRDGAAASWDRLQAAGDRTQGRDVVSGLWDGLVGATIGVVTAVGIVEAGALVKGGVTKFAGLAGRKSAAGLGAATRAAAREGAGEAAAASTLDDGLKVASQTADNVSASGVASALDEVPRQLPDGSPPGGAVPAGQGPGPATPSAETAKAPPFGHLTDQQQIDLLDKTNALLAKAEAVEPATTKSIQTITEAMGGQMEGLKDRLKRPGRLVEKIAKDVTRKGLSVEAAADNIADTVRYTSVFPPEKLADGTVAVLKKFADEGYKIVELKNTWPDKMKSYKGINVQLRSPNGQLIEAQFHTPEGLWAKGPGTHHLYEEMGKLFPADRSNPAWAALDDEQLKIFNSLRVPDNVEKIPSIPKKKGP
ncbi:hypothetical protein [Methylobacter sp. YRD-M1]|uniref:hypothetical protein n=1 Tax=Methylobacter sp. YRD-M1 TaxID=2911520 RepID=UPI00227A671B|nr:hypothetical protein [Methylobacter sp. YRD-M1]WAK02101.1 hypothetical protein LZ558_20175 [Methylobacter sp. YRD-M1]